ncbi:L-aspartate oxidase [Skermanella sp. TT6]|uniref:L-aspartate oxidase n=1 Tax=Skermanella cutis TaxID=2775420 RepID=A0ABX7B1A4_9PROT|nr:L-aspartate oxidase [Skermanella sp. TT6]QQP88090.1 L-aspartate oxidase [Skermanella sp. TT6]
MASIRDAGTVVVGSGLAGLTAALRLSPRPVTLLTKTGQLAGGSSPYAQGGIAAAIGPGDDPDEHAADTMMAGAGITDALMARLLAAEGADQVRRLLASGMPFDRAVDGTPKLGREAAHGRARIVHAGGDATGRVVVDELAARVRLTPSVTVMTRAFAHELVVRDGRVQGVLARHAEEGWVLHRAENVVLATGGIGSVYLHTTNPAENTGDGLAMAARAGARLGGLEFVQFHPTALAVGDGSGRPLPLLTEALRGAGAVLLDGAGRRFMAAEHPDAELAPRDIVARAVWRRVAAGDRVTLDMRAVLAGEPDHFPTVLGLCAEAGLDPRREPVPVAPAAHYHMGGVATDVAGRTSIAGLHACGEVADTGVHGANRLASNSLLEALVFGDRVARAISAAGPGGPPPPVAVPSLPQVPGGSEAALAPLRHRLRSAMYDRAGLSRDAAGMADGLSRIRDLQAEFDGISGGPAGFEETVAWGELRNLLLVARLVTHAASLRRESRGAHFRADFPEASEALRRRSFLTLADLGRSDALQPDCRQPLKEARHAVPAGL